MFPQRGGNGDATLIDGSVLNNRPFGPAIEALRHRPAHREVDRRFVYIDPKPGAHADTSNGALPGWFATVLRSLADIPREQPIRDNLAAISALSSRVRRLRFVVDGMTPQVDATIEAAVGTRFFLFKLTRERLSEWRSRTQTVAAKEAGFAYAAYGPAQAQPGRRGAGGAVDHARRSRRGAQRRGGAPRVVERGPRRRFRPCPAAATANGGVRSDYVAFLRTYDLEFRIRRLRFVIRRLTALAVAIEDPVERRAADSLKAALYAILAPYLERRRPAFYTDSDVLDAAAAATDPQAALDGLGRAMDLKPLDEATDARLVEVFAEKLPAQFRRALLRAYLGFPFYDIAMLPLLEGDAIDEFDEILVDRISPDDAVAIRRGNTLKGIQFNAFGAFFSRAYRENDYLWGRLHAADRLVDIVASALPEGQGVDALPFKQRLFKAILDTERYRLMAIPELIASLDTEGRGAYAVSALRRRRAIVPTAAKPPIISAQVAGSGTPGVGTPPMPMVRPC